MWKEPRVDERTYEANSKTKLYPCVEQSSFRISVLPVSKPVYTCIDDRIFPGLNDQRETLIEV